MHQVDQQAVGEMPDDVRTGDGNLRRTLTATVAGGTMLMLEKPDGPAFHSPCQSHSPQSE